MDAKRLPTWGQHGCQNETKSLPNRQNIIKMAPNIDPESMKNQGFVADAFLERPWAPKGWILGMKMAPFWSIFSSKVKKWHPKRHPTTDAEKILKMYAKRLRKWYQNGCRNQWFCIFFRQRRKCTKVLYLQYKTWFWACTKRWKINQKTMRNRCWKK